MSADPLSPEHWNGENKLAVLAETVAMNESSLLEYCSRKGLRVEQIIRWKEIAITAIEVAEPLGDSTDKVSQWEQVGRLSGLIKVAAVQIKCTLHDLEDSTGEVSESTIGIAPFVQRIKELLDDENLATDNSSVLSAELTSHTDSINELVTRTMMAFQFADRISQRLDNVSKSLAHITRLIEDERRMNSAEEWELLKVAIKQTYTMEAEKLIFDQVLAGIHPDQIAEEQSRAAKCGVDESSCGDNIELF